MQWFKKIILGQRLYFSFSTNKECILSHYYAFPKNQYPGGIRTRGGYDVDCAMPPGNLYAVFYDFCLEFPLSLSFFLSLYLSLSVLVLDVTQYPSNLFVDVRP
jgi:hypothetical protein